MLLVLTRSRRSSGTTFAKIMPKIAATAVTLAGRNLMGDSTEMTDEKTVSILKGLGTTLAGVKIAQKGDKRWQQAQNGMKITPK